MLPFFLLFWPHLARTFTIPDTGVTSCYDADGNQIVCPEPGQPFYGQDAHYGPGAMMLTINGSTTVSDSNTGLVWEVKAVSDGVKNPLDANDPDNTYTWDELAGFVSQLNSSSFGGYSDWRLPTVKELETIVDISIAEPGPTIHTSFFPNCQSGSYWTSVLDIDDPAMAWSINFMTSDDNIALTSQKLYVRAVRGGLL